MYKNIGNFLLFLRPLLRTGVRSLVLWSVFAYHQRTPLSEIKMDGKKITLLGVFLPLSSFNLSTKGRVVS